jgi:hypothetical protein
MTSPKALRQGRRLPDILRDLGMLSHDRIVTLMIEMFGTRSAGSAPAEYFKRNAGSVRGRVERVARASGPLSTQAKAALLLL